MRVVAYITNAAIIVAAIACAQPASAANPPKRIASFNVCADQLVVALADPEQIVALSPNARDASISVVVDEAAQYPLIGRQAEAMVPLKPDLVLVGPWDRPLTQRMLHVLGFRIVGVNIVNDLTAGIAQIREVAELLGHPERGEALIAKIEAARRRLAAAKPKATTAMLVGNAGYTVGPDSLAAALMAEAGLSPPPGAPGGYGSFVPLEKLITLRPDYLIMASIIERPAGQGALYLTHPALQKLYPPARRIVLPARYTMCAGPSLVGAFDYLTDVVSRLTATK